MVYALNVKPEHGYYVEVEPVDGDIRKVRLVDESPDGGWNPRNVPLAAGRPVHTEHLPTRMKWLDRKRHPVPDFDNGRFLNVSAKARAVIEELEPGVHQFVPVEYVDRDGNHLENRFVFVVGNRLDSLDREHTTLVLRDGVIWVPVSDMVRRGEEVPAGVDVNAQPVKVFNRAQIGGAHVWHDKHLTGGVTFISDAMFDAIEAHGLTGLRPGPIETV